MKEKLIVEFCDGKRRVARLDSGIAFAAARGIAQGTHCAVTLIGEYGTAEFNTAGGGSVIWNDKSTLPGETTTFTPNTTVCL